MKAGRRLFEMLKSDRTALVVWLRGMGDKDFQVKKKIKNCHKHTSPKSAGEEFKL